jgi:hypothetical protein
MSGSIVREFQARNLRDKKALALFAPVRFKISALQAIRLSPLRAWIGPRIWMEKTMENGSSPFFRAVSREEKRSLEMRMSWVEMAGESHILYQPI